MNCSACDSNIHEDDKLCNECGASLTVSWEMGWMPSNAPATDVANSHRKNSAPMNYIKHLWDGNGGLTFTFWAIFILGSVLLGLVLPVLAVVIGDSYGTFFDSTSKIFFLWVFTVLHLIYLLYSAVCVWRSANKFEGAKIWAILAKVVVGLVILRKISDGLALFLGQQKVLSILQNVIFSIGVSR